jgi:hypothetical protein
MVQHQSSFRLVKRYLGPTDTKEARLLHSDRSSDNFFGTELDRVPAQCKRSNHTPPEVEDPRNNKEPADHLAPPERKTPDNHHSLSKPREYQHQDATRHCHKA